ncbi:MAG: plasmid pRiA4b ORF-3 family protein [Oscillospiraceae bacterium]|nr:plasmid pRiA4b ORF-3 family protein [Oscillospiraceae bacterium]
MSVSLGTGCYRHIKISGDCTLEELHGAILDAFGFDDDHAHAFFLDNKAWQGDGYYSRYMEDEERYTCDLPFQMCWKKSRNLFIFLISAMNGSSPAVFFG